MLYESDCQGRTSDLQSRLGIPGMQKWSNVIQDGDLAIWGAGGTGFDGPHVCEGKARG